MVRNCFPNCRRGLCVSLFAAAACSLSACMSYGENVVYQLYQNNADRCAQNEAEACVAMLQSTCDAPARVCTEYAPQLQAQASKQLSQSCRAKNQPACQALDTVACDNGDSAVCARLGDQYASLYASCKADHARDCDSLSTMVWPKAQTAQAEQACKNGDTIACRVVSSSASAMKVNIDKTAQFAMF